MHLACVFRYWFWIDLLGVLPLEVIVLAVTHDEESATKEARYLALIRLIRMVGVPVNVL